jgi:DNA-binding HxlR family transcriptional regulator
MAESPVARVDRDDLRLATRVIGGKWKTAILYRLA